ncbi:MAG: MerC domain-containing protein [Myxococcota bacterium]
MASTTPSTGATTTVPRTWPDRLGSVLSSACAVHCGLLALFPAVLPGLSLGFLANEGAEWAFVLSAVAMAAFAAAAGFRHHRSLVPGAVFAAGALLLLAGRFGEALGAGHELGLVFAIGGGVTLVAAHIINARRCRHACAAPAAA